MKFRSPAVLTVVGVGATLGVTAVVIVVLLRFGGGAKAVSDNAALIGALVALGGVFTTQMVNSALDDQRAKQARNTEQAQRQRELAVEGQRSQDDALQTYLYQMGELLLDRERPLRKSHLRDEVRTLARARTLTVLSRFDGERKQSVMQFLYESGLVTKEQMVVNLNGADLSGADLREADLQGADLQGVDLRGANLSQADLSEADLSGADLSRANMFEANLSEADLTGANLSNAALYCAYLRRADVSSRIDLPDVNLSGSYLSNADLSDINLARATLVEADLSEANLFDATGLDNGELENMAPSLEDATMPNGQKYEDWRKDREGGKETGEND